MTNTPPSTACNQFDFSGDAYVPPTIPDVDQVQGILSELRERPLLEGHREDLKKSGLTDETIAAAQLCSATAEESQQLGFHASPALVIPYQQHPGYVRIKPDVPRVDAKGRSTKYETPRGSVNQLYIPPNSRNQLNSMIGTTATEIIITEGEKKALAADQHNFVAMGVPGVWGWKSPRGALQELNQIDWQGKRVNIVFDSDVTHKIDVKEAITALAAHLQELGGDVHVVLLPDVEGCSKTGLDDFLVAKGADALRHRIDNAGDWFDASLSMLEPGLSANDLEAAVQPIYRLIKQAGALAMANLADKLRQRLKGLGYISATMPELKRAIRGAPPYQPKGFASSSDDDTSADSTPEIRFVSEGPNGNHANNLELQGLYDLQGEEPRQLTNFTLSLDEDVRVEDDLDPQRKFVGMIGLHGRESPFSITAQDFANNSKLTAAIFEAAGPKVEVHCKPETLRTAISAVSSPESRRVITNFGWNELKDVYVVQNGRITTAGFIEASDDDDVQLDLSGSEFGRRLGLQALELEQLGEVKSHVINDLICLCPNPVVGLSLLASVALAVLYTFLDGFNRPALWLVGLSGTGKSFMAKLFQNFFGDFPMAGENAIMSWLSTSNRIQHEGYYFRGALYVVDDYKPEHCQPWQATALLQAYADSSARSRLRRDATAGQSREIRGILLSTGEDVPDHSASTSARMIKIAYPSCEKDLERGRRCVQQRQHYSGITADFIRHILANERPEAFIARVNTLQQQYYQLIAGRDNDVRIAGNFAMLGAAFEEIATYMQDVWPGVDEVRQQFVEESLVSQMNVMVSDVGEQKSSQVFLSTLAMLIQQDVVQIQGLPRTTAPMGSSPTLVGRTLPSQRSSNGIHGGCRTLAPADEIILEIWTGAAVGAVHGALCKQGRPGLKISGRALVSELREGGVLLSEDNEPLPTDASNGGTRQVSIDGQNKRGFRIRESVLLEGW